MDLRGRSFLKILDHSKDEIEYLIDLAMRFKEMKRDKIRHDYLRGKNIVLLFEKTSTRTRCAFEVAAMDLGMGVTNLDPRSCQMGKKESIEDTAKVLGRMYDAIEYRGFDQKVVEEIALNAGVPVYNGLTNEFHPTQMLADIMTIREELNKDHIKICYLGDAANNVANSLMVTCAKLGIDFSACGPSSLMPEKHLVEICQDIALDSGSKLSFSDKIEKAAKDADVIYTDVWVSMGEPDSVWKERIELLKPYQVNDKVMALASKDAIFMHCLPSFHDLDTDIAKDIYKRFKISEMEVTDKVFRSEKSVVYRQAENRMHTIKALLYATLNDEEEMI